jgi:predicted nucleic acid-binding protein
MSPKKTVFCDTDVVISSLLSDKGASYCLITGGQCDCFISNLSKLEILEVAKRLNIDGDKVKNQIKEYYKIIKSKSPDDFKQYVKDLDDAHIVAGAYSAGVDILVTYNKKDYRIDLIKGELGFLVLAPGEVLQYLRVL